MRARIGIAGLLSAAILLIGSTGSPAGSSRSLQPAEPPAYPHPYPLLPPRYSRPAVPPPGLDPQYRASAISPFAAGCDGVAARGTLFVNAEVEPSLAINPANTSNLVASWQQDRWSSGGARGIVAAASMDGGKTWTQRAMAFSRCGGGTPDNGGDYARVSDTWLSAAPDGTVHQIVIAFNDSVSAVLASRSTDGGATWSATRTLIRDTDSTLFNDKCSITADPVTQRYVYAVWDRLIGTNQGPTEFTRSTDEGQTWEAPRAIYNPGVNNQTIGNVIVVLPDGTLVDLFVEIHGDAKGNVLDSFLKVIRSIDNGTTWSAPTQIAQLLAVGTTDPNTGATVRDGTLVPQIAVAPGGALYVVWQDSRFSGGAHDGIAIAHSSDGGMTWSAPAQVNAATSVPAFTPSVHVRDDGAIGVSYFHFRPDTGSTATLLTDYWLARSANGTTWMENQIAGPFDIALAPRTSGTSGYFVGDYEALSSVGNVFVPLFAQTSADPTDPTDVFVAPQMSATRIAAAKSYDIAVPTPPPVVTPQMRMRVNENIARALHEGPMERD